MREALVGARCTASGANDLLRGWAARLHSQQQIINDRFAHFTQIVRGESELLRLGVHGGLKREHFCVIKHVRGVFKGFQQRNPCVDTEHFQMAFVFSAICKGRGADSFGLGYFVRHSLLLWYNQKELPVTIPSVGVAAVRRLESEKKQLGRHKASHVQSR